MIGGGGIPNIQFRDIWVMDTAPSWNRLRYCKFMGILMILVQFKSIPVWEFCLVMGMICIGRFKSDFLGVDSLIF